MPKREFLLFCLAYKRQTAPGNACMCVCVVVMRAVRVVEYLKSVFGLRRLCVAEIEQKRVDCFRYPQLYAPKQFAIMIFYARQNFWRQQFEIELTTHTSIPLAPYGFHDPTVSGFKVHLIQHGG